MSENTLTQAARETRAAYKRAWARRNPEKNKEYISRYWERKAQENAEQQNGGEENAAKNADD